MWELILDCLLDSLKDCALMLPILFLAYLLMEFIEQRAGEKLNRTVAKVGVAGPALGGLLGAVPQCGFSGAIAGFYAAGIVTLGTLLSVFLSTSDEMLPILIGSQIAPGEIVKILLFKVIGGILAGFLIDIVLRIIKKQRVTDSEHIHEFCEQEHCECEENIWISALKHTAKVILLIFVVTFAINFVFEKWGAEFFRGIITNMPILGEALMALIGLIPNCSASVLITELYVEGVVSAGQLIAGLMANAGVGLLVLFRLNKKLKENLMIVVLLYVCAVILGVITSLIW
ncbi:MAG: arsenic efflux protein [Ruminococcus sp.]|nr:arsenic efflux protein [Ruminococcus sp.]